MSTQLHIDCSDLVRCKGIAELNDIRTYRSTRVSVTVCLWTDLVLAVFGVRIRFVEGSDI